MRPRRAGVELHTAACRAVLCGASAFAAVGCNLLLDIGDHHAAAGSSTTGAQSSAGGGGAGGVAVGGGGAASVGGGGRGGAGGGGCTADWSPDVQGPQAIACGQVRPIAVGTDPNWVFWINEGSQPGTGQLMRAGHEGSDFEELVSGIGKPRALRNYPLNPNVIFTNDFGPRSDVGVFNVPKLGGRVQPLESDDYGTAALAAVSSTGLFSEAWKPTEPVRLRKTNGNVECFVYTSSAQPGGRITAIAGDPENVYFAEKSGAVAEIKRLPGSGCFTGSATTFASSQDDVRAMVRYASRVYWITPTALRFKDESEPDTVAPHEALSGQNDLGGLTALGDGVVAVTSTADGTVRVINVDLHTKNLVASDQGGPVGIGDDGGVFLFWANRDSGEIMRLDLK